jgi:hypothetical protein
MKKGIKIISAKYIEDYKIEIVFSDGKINIFDYASTVLRGHEECKPYIDIENFKKFTILWDRKTIAWGENWDMILTFETIYSKKKATFKKMNKKSDSSDKLSNRSMSNKFKSNKL